MKVTVTEVRTYEVPDLEPEVIDAIKHQDLDELLDFLTDLSDWPAESINTVKVEVARPARATYSEACIVRGSLRFVKTVRKLPKGQSTWQLIISLGRGADGKLQTTLGPCHGNKGEG